MDNLAVELIVLGVASLISASGAVVSNLAKRSVRAFEIRQTELELRADRIRADFDDRIDKVNHDQDRQNQQINRCCLELGILQERTKNM